jgi:hypothetical protein
MLFKEETSTKKIVPADGNDRLFILQNLNNDEAREQLSNIPTTTNFILIESCEFIDFTGINLCGIGLIFIKINNTESNFDEQNYECAKEISNGMYDMEIPEEPKKLGFSEPTFSTNIYGKPNYSLKL